MFHSFRQYVESHFGSVLVISFFVGLLTPGLDAVPPVFLPVFLAIVIYFSTSKTRAGDFATIRYGKALAFVALRYVIVPIALYFIVAAVLPSFAVPILLLALMPAGASCAAMAAIMEANVGLALGITLLSGFLVPLSVPFAFWLIGKNGVTLDLQALFWSLVKIVVLPMLLYYQGARRIPRLAEWSRQTASFLSVLFIGIVVALAVAQRRSAMIADPTYLAEAAAMTCVVFALLYAVGWFFPFRGDRRIRMTQTLASGVMNNALGISLAVLYFPPEITLFMVITEFPWTLGVALFRHFTREKIVKTGPQP